MGVHYPTAPLAADIPTARCLILVTPDGQRTMNTYLGAGGEFALHDLDEDGDRGLGGDVSGGLSVRPAGGAGGVHGGGADGAARRGRKPPSPSPMRSAWTGTAMGSGG